MNMIKKYKLKGLKKLGIKKSWGFLGDVWGCVDSAIRKNNKEDASDYSFFACFTLREAADRMTALEERHGKEDAFDIFKGELLKDASKFYDLGSMISHHNGNLVRK